MTILQTTIVSIAALIIGVNIGFWFNRKSNKDLDAKIKWLEYNMNKLKERQHGSKS